MSNDEISYNSCSNIILLGILGLGILENLWVRLEPESNLLRTSRSPDVAPNDIFFCGDI